MPIPLLEITPKTQNQRVPGYDVADEDDPQLYRLSNATSDSDINALIWAAYRQVFSEHLVLERYRQVALESQLRNRAINVREFIRGLGKSEVYRELVAETNSNYRLVDLTFKRFLGRATYDRDEQIAWSIVIATKGLHGFIDAILDGDEYRQNFGNDIVPYQRRRMEARPFNLVNPRYADYWRSRLIEREGQSFQALPFRREAASKAAIRQAIPFTFLKMAQSTLTGEVNYQRTIAQVTASIKSRPLLDTTKSVETPQQFVKPTAVSLPYRYLPAVPKA